MEPTFFTHYQRGSRLLAMKQYERAIGEYEAALALSPENNGVKLQLARCWMQLKKLDKARFYIDQVIKSTPGNSDAHYLGSFTARKTKQGLASIEAAIALFPSHGAYHERHSFLLMRLYRYKDATSACQRALELAPETASHHRQMALTIFEEAEPYGLFRTRLGLSHTKFEQAAFHVARALELEPENTRSHAMEARLKKFDLEYEEARDKWQEALRLNPTDQYAQFNLKLAQEKANEERILKRCWRHFYKWMPWPLRLPLTWSLVLAAFWWGIFGRSDGGQPFPFLILFGLSSLITPLLLRDWLQFVPDHWFEKRFWSYLRPLKKPPLR